MMENKLKKLFDYQRFEQNKKLGKLIKETEKRYAAELSDEDLSLVNAAGDPEIPEAIKDGSRTHEACKDGRVVTADVIIKNTAASALDSPHP